MFPSPFVIFILNCEYDALGRRLLDDKGIYRKQYRAPRLRPSGK